jgi:serine/threonine protein kinase
VDDFRLEVNNLRRLKQSRLRHDRIMMYSCSLLHGNECNIFFDWADWHLFDLLNENCDKATCFDISPVNLLRESSNLAEALMFLHDQLGDIFCCHMDLKPDNILIIKHKDAPVGQWMITDFGISTFKETSGRSNDGLLSVRELEVNIANKTTLATRTVPKRAPGPFQPPEVELSPGAAQFGRKSDVWSFGCVLAMVVAFALGGRQLVEELGEARAADSDLTDYFYQVCSMVAEVKPSISKWLDGLSGRFPTDIIWIPRCSELIKSTLRIRQEQRPHSRDVTRILKEICSSISQRPRWGTVNESRHPLPSEHGNMESVRAFSVPNTSLAIEKAQSINSASQFAPSSRINTDDFGSENDPRTSYPHLAGLLPARTGSDQSQSSLHEEGPLDFSPSNRFGSHSRPSSLSPYGNSQCYESGIIRDYDGPLDAPTPLPPESRSDRTESNESLPRVQNLVHRATTLSLGDKADCSIRASSKFELPEGSLLQSSISASGDRVVFLSKKAAYVYSLEGLHSDASRTPRAEIEGSWHRASLAGNFVALRGEASKVVLPFPSSTFRPNAKPRLPSIV